METDDCVAIRSGFDRFMIDLISKQITDSIVIEERLRYFEYPADTRCCVFAIQSTTNIEVDFEQVRHDLSGALPEALIIQHPDGLLAVCSFPPEVAGFDEGKRRDQWIHSIKDILRDHQLSLGASGSENSISHLGDAYERASRTIEIALRVQKHMPRFRFAMEKPPFPGYEVFLYERYEIYHILEKIAMSRVNIITNSSCYEILSQLRRLDIANNMNSLDLLYCYLMCAHSASRTAEILFMHRNNVIYHINRIKTMFRVDFSDPSVGFLFLMAFYMLDLYGVECLDPPAS